MDNLGSEKDHAVTFEGATFEETQKLPEGNSPDKLIEDKGRGFKGYYQFTLKTVPGADHRWLDSGKHGPQHARIGMALMVQTPEKWVQLGFELKTRRQPATLSRFIFEVPAKYVMANQTVFKLTSKTADEINAYPSCFGFIN